MGKAKMVGMNKSYIPNSKSDMRFRKKIYQRGREIAQRDLDDIRQSRDLKQMEKQKHGRPAV